MRNVNTQNYDFYAVRPLAAWVHGGSEATGVGGIDSLPVAVGHDAAEHDAPDLAHRHLFGLDLAGLLLLQRGKKAFHSGVVVEQRPVPLI